MTTKASNDLREPTHRFRYDKATMSFHLLLISCTTDLPVFIWGP